MSRVIQTQTTWSKGEFDPRLAARHDYEDYYKSAETLTNVVVMQHGGLVRRPGMKYIDNLTDTEVRFVKFEFNVTQTYLFVFADSKAYIYKDGVLQTNINSSGNDYLTTPYPVADIQDISITQSADTMIICHNDYEPRTIVRAGSHTDWTLSTISFSYLPTFDFRADYDAATFTLHTSSPKVGDTIRLNISGGNPVVAAHVGGMFFGNNGIIRIETISTTSGSQWISGVLLQEFENNNTISGADASLEEVAWSSARGYPGTVTFHEQRLWMSNSTARPQTLWGSVLGDFFNFDVGTSLDDESIDITLDTDQVNAIYHLVSGPNLQIFTSGAEFYIPDRPITPTKVSVLRQTRYGILKAVRPINIDGATIFIQSNGKQVREYLYTFAEESYTANEINILSPHLVSTPVRMDALTGDVNNEGNYLYVVNDDGTVAVFITNRAEAIGAWTRFTTDGEVKDVAVLENIVYFYVKRSINGTDKYFIEALDRTYYTDCSIQVNNSPASTIVSGLGHLNGEECRVRADGSVQANATPSSGSITLTTAAEDIEVGLNYDVTIKTMPVNMVLQSGPIHSKRRRIVTAEIQLYQSAGLEVEGRPLPVRGFGSSALGSAINTFTGIKSVPILGYSKTSQITVTQVDPMPLTLLGLNLTIQVTG